MHALCELLHLPLFWGLWLHHCSETGGNLLLKVW